MNTKGHIVAAILCFIAAFVLSLKVNGYAFSFLVIAFVLLVHERRPPSNSLRPQ